MSHCVGQIAADTAAATISFVQVFCQAFLMGKVARCPSSKPLYKAAFAARSLSVVDFLRFRHKEFEGEAGF
jgi:hypothetical protein